jgi:hypothetical protein
MHGLQTIVRLNMSQVERDEAARRSAAAKPSVPPRLDGGADMIDGLKRGVEFEGGSK